MSSWLDGVHDRLVLLGEDREGHEASVAWGELCEPQGFLLNTLIGIDLSETLVFERAGGRGEGYLFPYLRSNRQSLLDDRKDR